MSAPLTILVHETQAEYECDRSQVLAAFGSLANDDQGSTLIERGEDE